MKKIFFLVICCIGVMCLSGCSDKTGDNQNAFNENKEMKLEIKDSGWSYVQDPDWGNYVTYGVEIYNPEDNYLAGFPTVKCVAKDKDGKILFTSTGNLDYIYPGETLYYGDYWNDLKEKPATVEITVEMANDDWENPKTVNYPKNTEIILSNTSEYVDDVLDRHYTGEIENKSGTDISSALIVVIYKKDNKIVGGYYTYSDSLNAGQKTTFDLYASPVPEYDSYELSSHVAMIN